MNLRLAAALALAAASGLAAAQYRPMPEVQRPPTITRPAQSTTPATTSLEAFKPEAVVVSGGPPDQFRDDHNHAHAHLCKAEECRRWCDWREDGQWAGYARVKSAKAECNGYCMKDC